MWHFYYRNISFLQCCIFGFLVFFSFWILGYNTWDLISGLGRADWARGQFHWESAVPQMVVVFLIYAFSKLRLNVFISVFYFSIVIISFLLYGSLYFDQGLRELNYLLLAFSLCICVFKSKEALFFCLLAVLIQIRRGFEWGEFSSIILMIFGLCIFLQQRAEEPQESPISEPMHRFAFQACLFIFLQSSALFFYTEVFSPIKRVLSSQAAIYYVQNTAVGPIKTSRPYKGFSQFLARFKEKEVICLPFCPGIAYLSGGKHPWPLQYLYRRDRVKTYEFYSIHQKQNPDYFVIDNSYLVWSSYPEPQFSLISWKLDRHSYNFKEAYPELFEERLESYKLVESWNSFDVYKLERKRE